MCLRKRHNYVNTRFYSEICLTAVTVTDVQLLNICKSVEESVSGENVLNIMCILKEYAAIFCFEKLTETAVYFITRSMVAEGVLRSPETLQRGFCQGLGLSLTVNTGNVQLDPAHSIADYVLYTVYHCRSFRVLTVGFCPAPIQL